MVCGCALFAKPTRDLWFIVIGSARVRCCPVAQILLRMGELGMTPVMPGFSGFVPPAYAALNPNVSYLDTPSWNGFPATYVPAFTEVMQMFGEGACRFLASVAGALVASVRDT